MPKLILHQNSFPCYNGLLYRHNNYLYSSRSGQIWKTKLPDVAHFHGDLKHQKLWVFLLSKDKRWLTRVNTVPRVTVTRISNEFLMYTIHNNKHYWLYKEMLHEVKWVRSSVTEYLMITNFP